MAVRLLDTNIVSYNMRSHSLGALYRSHLAGHVLAVSFQTVAELIYGGAMAGWNHAKWAKLERTLSALMVLEKATGKSANDGRKSASRFGYNPSHSRTAGSPPPPSPLAWNS